MAQSCQAVFSEEDKSIYGPNLLTNPSAEDGLNDWGYENVNVVDGGKIGSKCFELLDNGKLYRNIPGAIGNCIAAYKASLLFLPESESFNADVETSMQAIVNYDDGTNDVFKAPCEIEPIDISGIVLDSNIADDLFQVEIIWSNVEVEFNTNTEKTILDIDYEITSKAPLGKAYLDNMQLFEKYIDDTSRWVSFYKGGTLAPSNNIEKFMCPANLKIKRVMAHSDIAPTGGPIVIDIKVNNVSVFGGGPKLTIEEGELLSFTSTFPNKVVYALDVITYDIVSVGSTVAGSNLALTLVMT